MSDINQKYDDDKSLDAIMIAHKYDQTALYLTFPEFIDYPDCYSETMDLLNEIEKYIMEKSINVHIQTF